MARTNRKVVQDDSGPQPGGRTPRTCPGLQLWPRKIAVDYDQVSGLNELLTETYNIYLPFVQGLAAGEKARATATKIQKRLDKVQKIWDEAAAKTRAEVTRLETDLEEYSEQRCARLHWWKEGNVFSTLSIRYKFKL